MITILTNAHRATHHHILDQMFRGRAFGSGESYGWDASADDGYQIDRYDETEDPVYLISVDNTGDVIGSLRILPTVGETVLQNEFRDVFDAPVDFVSPTTWECTRFCVHPRNFAVDIDSTTTVASELLIELCALALRSGIEHIIGMYATPMIKIYRCIGWEPDHLARAREKFSNLAVGHWAVSESYLRKMRSQARRCPFPCQTI